MLKFDGDKIRVDEQQKRELFEMICQERSSGAVGYYDLPSSSQQLVEQTKEFAKDLFADIVVQDIVIIGIGGSSLGIKAIDSFLSASQSSSKTLHYLENSDPLQIIRTLTKLDIKTTLVVVISKSGTSVETISILKAAIAHFKIDLMGSKRLICITDPDSALDRFAAHYSLKVFHIPPTVGGRFSALSAVGMVPLTLAGYNTLAMLSSAEEKLETFFNYRDHYILSRAVQIAQSEPDRYIHILFSYASALEDFNKWFVQLWGESLGKKDSNRRRTKLIPVALIGSVDQHSFLQLIIDGRLNKSVTFIDIANRGVDLIIPDLPLPFLESSDIFNNESFADLISTQCSSTMASVKQSGTAVDKITLNGYSEDDIGELIIYFELLTSLVGLLLDVDTYDQPGVELGKEILYQTYKEKK